MRVYHNLANAYTHRTVHASKYPLLLYHRLLLQPRTNTLLLYHRLLHRTRTSNYQQYSMHAHALFAYPGGESERLHRIRTKRISVHSRTRAFMSISRLHTPRYVMKNNSSKFIVPTYDIDLMWHAHQMYPIAYEQVCPCRYVHVLLAPFCRQCVIRCLVFLL